MLERTGSLIPQKLRTNLSSIVDLRREMDRLWDDISAPVAEDAAMSLFSPACETRETDNAYMFKFEIPGMSKKDIHIDVTDHLITVSGEREAKKEDQKGTRRISELSYGSFYRQINLPMSVNADEVDAEYHQGILSIKAPKTESTKAHTVKIH